MAAIALLQLPSATFGDKARVQKPAARAKVSTALLELGQRYAEFERLPAAARSRPFLVADPGVVSDGESIVIDAVASGSALTLRDELLALGATDIHVHRSIVSARLPLRSIDRLAGLPGLHFARPFLAITWAGSTTTQGDAAQRSAEARSTHGVDGSGVTVGVISDSYNCPGHATTASGDVATGDLPTGVNVIFDFCNRSDEGRAMLQIVHDVAPGASLAFHSGTAGSAVAALAVNSLVSAGADVIVDDVFYFNEPMFQDGNIAQAAASAASSGVVYLSSAGNAADASYESVFRNSGVTGPNGGVLHDFDPGPGTVTAQPITVPVGTSLTIVLQWNQPFFSVSGAPGAATDVDFFLLAADGSTVLARSEDTNIGNDAIEAFAVTNIGAYPQGSNPNFHLQIENFTGPDPELIRYMYVDTGGTVTVDQFATYSGSTYGHSAAPGAAAVGAAAYYETPAFGVSPPLVEPFSGVGEVPVYFQTDGTPISPPELRLQPRFVAPDRGNTTFFGNDTDSDGFPNFAGTSASAPHAAGAAALLLEAEPTLTPAQVYAALADSALDMWDPGFDFHSGHGLIQVDSAISALANPAPTLNPVAGAIVAVGGTADIPLTASDVGGGSVSFAAPVLPGFCGLVDNGNGTATVSCTPTSGDVGRRAVVVTATDSGSPPRSDSQGFYVVVSGTPPTNNPPVLGAIGDLVVKENKSVELALLATDEDGDALVLSTEGLPAFCSLTDGGDGTGTIACSPSWSSAGTYPVTVTVTDNGVPVRSDSKAFSVVVLDGLSGPDMNGDGSADIFWRNPATGENRLYLMDGAGITADLVVNPVSPNWTVVGTGDYDDDGRNDILWRHTPTGALWIHFMNGPVVVSSGFVATVADTNWKVVGNGDYNGDGQADILWQHALSGTVWVYLMSGNAIVSSASIGAVPNLDWSIVGSGDYNGDGRSDILWRNSATGAIWMYLMNGAAIVSSGGVSVVPDLDWRIVGSGDYDGDGRSDVLWRNVSTGSNWMYRMNGLSIVLSAWISTVPDLSWQVVGHGDYNGDRKSDVLWQHAVTGNAHVYLMNGHAILASQSIAGSPGQGWTIVNAR